MLGIQGAISDLVVTDKRTDSVWCASPVEMENLHIRNILNRNSEPVGANDIICIFSGMQRASCAEPCIKPADTPGYTPGDNHVAALHKAPWRMIFCIKCRLGFGSYRNGRIGKITQIYPPAEQALLAFDRAVPCEVREVIGSQAAVIIRKDEVITSGGVDTGVACE